MCIVGLAYEINTFRVAAAAERTFHGTVVDHADHLLHIVCLGMTFRRAGNNFAP